MFTNENGEEISLQDVLSKLQGTDSNDMAASVMDFALYPVVDGTIGDPEYYLTGTEVIVTQISFIGPFISVELDFRNVGIPLLQQVMNVVSRFHAEANTGDAVMLSIITPLTMESGYTLLLADPLICVRGYSDQGNATTVLQLLYAGDNAAFRRYEIDYNELNADIDRELQELESYQITNEAIAAAEAEMGDENNEKMKSMFQPTFGLRTPEDKKKEEDKRISNNRDSAKFFVKNDERIGLTYGDDENQIQRREKK